MDCRNRRPHIIGVDEVGRGSLAGPITVAAVAARSSEKRSAKSDKLKKFLRGIRDSKKLSPKQREEWFRNLSLFTCHSSLVWAISSVGSATIDRIGISRAATLAVGRCMRKLTINYGLRTLNSKILLDGSLYAPRTYQNQETIIRGDERIPLIAAASIIAKVTRDGMMTHFDSRYSLYGLAIHKGYGTAMHRAAIIRHGPCALHRASFCKKLH